MYRLDNDTFDAEVKALLEDAQEEVPAGVWEAVSASVAGQAQAKERSSGWVWPSFAGVAAAAVAILLSLIPKVDLSIPQIGDILSFSDSPCDDVPQVQTPGFGSEIFDIIPAPERAFQSSSRVAMAVTETSPEPVDRRIEKEDVQEYVEKPAEAPSAVSSWVDPFEEMEVEDKAAAAKKAARRSLVGAGGNLASNGSNSFPGSTFYATIGAINTPSETTIREKSISTYGVPVSFGLSLTYPLSSRLAVGTGLNYSLLTRSFGAEYIEVENGVAKPAISADVTNQMQYVGIPLNLYCSIQSKPGFDVYCFVGAQIEKGISNKFVVEATENIRMNKSVPGVQLSAAAGLGVQFSLTDNLGLYIDPGVRYYFDCDQPRSIRTAKPFMMSLEAGLRFNLH